MNLIEKLEQEEIARLGKTIPEFAPGDTVVVSVNVVEGTRKRVQAFEGVVIGRRNRGLNSSFIVRKISSGEGVERTFQLYSPLIAGIEVKRRGDVRRAKLYYQRDRIGKAAEFPAQAKDCIVDRPIPHDIRLTPDSIEQIVAAEGTSRVAHQQVQELELGARQIQLMSVRGRPVSFGLKGQRTEHQLGFCPCTISLDHCLNALHTSQERPYTRNQLTHTEGLRIYHGAPMSGIWSPGSRVSGDQAWPLLLSLHAPMLEYASDANPKPEPAPIPHL